MKLSFREIRLLVYFIPIYCLKLINITAENKILIAVSILCFVSLAVQLIMEKFSTPCLILLGILALYSGLLIYTCGKQGAFFTVITLIAMKDIDLNKHFYKICTAFGIVMVCVSSYVTRTGEVQMRYINGEWAEIYKRSNILYISFMAVICLFCMAKKNIKTIHVAVFFIIGYCMYKYSGSRTGMICLIFLNGLFLFLRNKRIRGLKIVKTGCILSPLICMIFSIFTSFYYGKIDILYTLNSSLQGRLYQGHAFLEKYSLKLLGQRIFESTDPDNFWNLDCAYLDMLICYGIIFTLIWLISSMLVIKYMYENDRYVEVSILVMYAVYGICETFLPNCFLNVSLLLYGEYIYAMSAKSVSRT